MKTFALSAIAGLASAATVTDYNYTGGAQSVANAGTNVASSTFGVNIQQTLDDINSSMAIMMTGTFTLAASAWPVATTGQEVGGEMMQCVTESGSTTCYVFTAPYSYSTTELYYTEYDLGTTAVPTLTNLAPISTQMQAISGVTQTCYEFIDLNTATVTVSQGTCWANFNEKTGNTVTTNGYTYDVYMAVPFPSEDLITTMVNQVKAAVGSVQAATFYKDGTNGYIQQGTVALTMPGTGASAVAALGAMAALAMNF